MGSEMCIRDRATIVIAEMIVMEVDQEVAVMIITTGPEVVVMTTIVAMETVEVVVEITASTVVQAAVTTTEVVAVVTTLDTDKTATINKTTTWADKAITLDTTTITINMVAVPKETKHHGNNNNKLHSNNNMVAINRYRVARNNSGINGEVITTREVDQEVMVEPEAVSYTHLTLPTIYSV